MVDTIFNITHEFWDEDLFDCEATNKGARTMADISEMFRGQEGFGGEIRHMTIDEAFERYDMELVGQGHARLVVVPPDDWVTGSTECIAKLQWSPSSLQNRQEIHIWTNVNGRQAALLAPVLDYDMSGSWLLMPKAETSWDIPMNELLDMESEMRSELRARGFSTHDIDLRNIGRVEGRDVMIDYGTLEFTNQ